MLRLLRQASGDAPVPHSGDNHQAVNLRQPVPFIELNADTARKTIILVSDEYARVFAVRREDVDSADLSIDVTPFPADGGERLSDVITMFRQKPDNRQHRFSLVH
jgi:hypothetical protein